ncbi:hypothetical protein TcasGA2_TC004913 [Tribolium castaneum]|uniref:Uncharacterized protein n=1 Tax=Tribolium castaneum TaxID=7070 RepID=D6WCK2_TRICA|nr:hypothetical protein TcasGA2_TC004913 [Tribolium castaneum]
MHMLLSRRYVRNFAFYEYPLRVPVTSTIMASDNYVGDKQISSGPSAAPVFDNLYTCNLQQRDVLFRKLHTQRAPSGPFCPNFDKTCNFSSEYWLKLWLERSGLNYVQ